MAHPGFTTYLGHLMMQEIAPAITNEEISLATARDFAAKVLDRFRNPHIEHLWLSITMQYSSKMKTRNIPVIRNYLARFDNIPGYMSLGWAAHLLFMKGDLAADGKYYGDIKGKKYLINDDNAGWYAEKWKNAASPAELVQGVLGDESFWGINLAENPALLNTITSKLQELILHGAASVLLKIAEPAKPIEVS
jgi:tagaturonate reductase